MIHLREEVNLKEAGTSHWLSPNKGADNSSGLTALGAGIRYFEGTFASILSYTCFWSATESVMMMNGIRASIILIQPLALTTEIRNMDLV